MSKQWENNLQALYQASRQELPPAELDKKIRLAAQKAVQRKSSNLKWYLSSAALVLLTVNVVLFTYVPEPELIETPRQATSLPAKKIPSLPLPKPEPAPVPVIETEIDNMASRDVIKRDMLPKSASQSNTPLAPERSEDMQEDSLKTGTLRKLQIKEAYQEASDVGQNKGISLPQNLPFDMNSLLAGHDDLKGRQSSDSLEISRDNKPVLKMKKVEQGIAIEAYQGAQRWGVDAEWGHSSERALNCLKEEYLICELTGQVQGGFENGHLIFIRWIQKYVP
jgi:hypothetical protein